MSNVTKSDGRSEWHMVRQMLGCGGGIWLSDVCVCVPAAELCERSTHARKHIFTLFPLVVGFRIGTAATLIQ